MSDCQLHQDLITRNQYIRGYDSVGLLWEQKAAAVLDCIGSPSHRVSAAVALAKACRVPWSSCIAKVVEETCQLTHDGLEFISE